jgi:cell division protein FtsW
MFSSFEGAGSNLWRRTRGDRVIWAIVIVLSLVSLLAVYSASSANPGKSLFKQSSFIIAGLIIIYFAHRINYTIYSRIALIMFMVSIPLLMFTLLFGSSTNEASRWLKIPVLNITFQTSDMAKLALFMYVSRQLSRKQEVIKDFKKGFLPVIAPIVIICVLIAPANLSTALMLGASSMMLCFIGRVSGKHLLMVASIVVIPLVLLIVAAKVFYNKEEKAMDLPAILEVGRLPTWISRVQHYIYDNKNDNGDKDYQSNQAKIAIANGGVIGMGPGRSETRSILPDSSSDFIYAIIIEEYGLAGGFFLVALYMVFLFRCIRIFRRCPYAFGAFLALGLSFTLVIQAMLNMGVAVNLLPVTGVTLPLVSMGGTSLLFTCFAIGIILSVARNVEAMETPVGKKEPAAVAA